MGRYEGKRPGGPGSTVFLGQNWATLANTPFRRYKHFTHEGGISTPLIAHWPAQIPQERDGKLERQPGHVSDLMATIVNVTGAKYPSEYNRNRIQPMEGVSLVPAFSGKPLNRKNPIYFEHEGNRAIRDGKWKLVMKLKGPWELYDIEADRTEQHGLANERPELVKKLANNWDAWAKRALSVTTPAVFPKNNAKREYRQLNGSLRANRSDHNERPETRKSACSGRGSAFPRTTAPTGSTIFTLDNLLSLSRIFRGTRLVVSPRF